ncbi:MAG TPA: MFS transporter [Rectinemataceae bacterium]|nr:MFS transporter [Rectinemataceae bacterium]
MTIVSTIGRAGLKFSSAYFLYFAICGISSPYLQIILKKIGYGPAAVGLLLGLYELIGILGPIVLARKADALGRFNPFLMGSGLAIILGGFLLVAIQSPLATVLGLGLLSLGLKTPVPVMDTSVLIALDKARAAGRKPPNYGTLRGLGSIGYVIVVLIVQAVPGFDDKPPIVMILAMVGLTLLFLLSLSWLPETGREKPAGERASVHLSWIDPTFIAGLAVIALGRLALASYNSFFSLYLTESLEWHAIGIMSALAATVEIPAMIVSWKFLRTKSPMEVINLASAAIFVRLLIYAIFPTRAGVIAGQLLHAICYGLFLPASVTFINLKTPPGERTTGNALLLGFGMGLPAFLGSAFGGLIVEAVGYRWLFAIFSSFAVASMALYHHHGDTLRAVR